MGDEGFLVLQYELGTAPRSTLTGQLSNVPHSGPFPFCKIEMNPTTLDISNALGSTDGKEKWFTSLPLIL